VVPQGEVHVHVGARGATDADDRLTLAAVLAQLAGVSAAVLERRCAHCAGRHGPHGRPVPVSPAACVGWAVSLSRAGASVAMAVTNGAPVGIDLASVAAVARHDLDSAAFNAAEIAVLHRLSPATAAQARATLWTAKEAVLKLTGQGLRVDPRDLTVTLAEDGSPGAVQAWDAAPAALPLLRLLAVPTGPGLVGTVAVLTEGPVTLRLLPRAF